MPSRFLAPGRWVGAVIVQHGPVDASGTLAERSPECEPSANRRSEASRTTREGPRAACPEGASVRRLPAETCTSALATGPRPWAVLDGRAAWRSAHDGDRARSPAGAGVYSLRISALHRSGRLSRVGKWRGGPPASGRGGGCGRTAKEVVFGLPSTRRPVEGVNCFDRPAQLASLRGRPCCGAVRSPGRRGWEIAPRSCSLVQSPVRWIPHGAERSAPAERCRLPGGDLLNIRLAQRLVR